MLLVTAARRPGRSRSAVLRMRRCRRS